MENRSRHYGDVQKWIEKVIDSCETYQQTHTIKKLIWNFESQMRRNKVDSRLIWSIESFLNTQLSIKRQSFLKQ